MAKLKAEENFNKDQAFRLWATQHGGVYVPETEKTPANPNLAHIENRDITLNNGKKLTLMNPAYMLRQLIDDFPDEYGIKGRITSLKYFWDGNKPDKWEEAALIAFEAGEKEVFEKTTYLGKPAIRLIRPMYTKESCLKCHGIQGYKVGDVRGGVGVIVPFTPFTQIESNQIFVITITHVIIFFAGLLIIITIFLKSKKTQKEKIIARAKNVLHSRNMDNVLKNKTAELELINDKLISSERLAVIGKFAGSISHELRNPLSVIDSSLYVIKKSLKDPSDNIKQHYTRISQAIKYSTAIIESTLESTKINPPIFVELSIDSIFNRLLSEFIIPVKIKLISRNKDTDYLISADENYLIIIFTNILQNSIQAINGDGTITISVKEKYNQLIIFIHDSGPGIPKENLSRLFEPLFTTKANGIGFGLAIVKELIDRLGFFITIDQEKGTEFQIHIPKTKYSIIPDKEL